MRGNREMPCYCCADYWDYYKDHRCAWRPDAVKVDKLAVCTMRGVKYRKKVNAFNCWRLEGMAYLPINKEEG